MPSIPGRYEFDDGDLRPGKKKEGGLHQNLFDKDGKLKGNARFIPDDRSESEQAELLFQAVGVLLMVGIARGMPHAKRVWAEKVLPTVRSRIDWVTQRRVRRGKEAPIEIVAPDVALSREVVAAGEATKANMTNSEAQARYLLALAARQFSDEQMRMLANANLQEDDGFLDLERALSGLPPDRVTQMIEQLEANLSLLSGDGLSGPEAIVGVKRVDADPAMSAKSRDRYSLLAALSR